ncbi:hypothetical protein [Arcanobacterium hippocoleae]|uniref:Uncharacterized protein n=1 Tax=Arcanobacterium hippocoleae TaxID=149017 RepID=A0ABU1T1H7_9ACTO|nr:hypothetical protein [Arcanobacterium hippocoleae]MDR6939233.1 hypothetical protein [Arcanobacterium hippocoleae]
MRIEVLYKNHCYEEFDSNIHTASEPYKQGVNILTDWILYLDKLVERGIVLVEHWHDVKNSVSTVDIDGFSIPVARRSLGSAILLVAPHELNEVVWLKKDGEKILWREGEDLINGERFFAMEQLCYSDSSVISINKRALAVFDYLTNAHPEESSEQIASSMGYTLSTIERIRDAEIAQIDLNETNTADLETNGGIEEYAFS